MIRVCWRGCKAGLLSAAVVMAVVPGLTPAQPAGIDADAMEMLGVATQFVGSLQQFSVDTPEGALDFARETLDNVAPAGDLIYSNAFEILIEDVTEAFMVGPGLVEGRRCIHLAFRNVDVDWQLWVQEGAEPLPCKLVITTPGRSTSPNWVSVRSRHHSVRGA